jgi:predicted flap endonuclease-1-like 5' DNA nuclease
VEAVPVHQIGEVEDIDEANESKLKSLEIGTTDDLLARAATPAGRAELAAAIGVDAGEILVWANCADLMRIDGVGMQFADLLEAAGVDTIPELAQRNPANLHTRLVAVNAEGNLTGRAPTSAEVEAWIVQAKALPRILVYGGGDASAGSGGPAPAPAPAPAAPERAAPEPAPAAPEPAPVAPAPPVTPASAPAAVDDAASSTAAAAEDVASTVSKHASAAADTAADTASDVASDAGATTGDASTTAHGMMSRSDGLAQGRSWLQKLAERFRGK